MATSFSGIKQIIDLPSWQQAALASTSLHTYQNGVAGSTLSDDKRASQYKQNLLWFMNTATTLLQYRTKGNSFHQLTNPALAGTFGIGACTVFCPSLGPRGTLAAGATTTKVTLTTALTGSVGPNQLVGQRIRIIGNAAGSSGKIEERTIIANTSGTTPAITLDSALTFTPANGDGYEILAGRLYMLSAGTVAAGVWKFYDVATNVVSGSLATANLPATIATGSAILSMDELHTPIQGPSGTNMTGATINGEVGGYFGTLTATAASGTTLTGQAANGDSAVLANEYRNFQIRIVEDTTTPTAVGQRRRITSHTAGVSPVYTVPTWTVTPSSSAKYMIENNNDIILWTGSTTTTYRYTPDAWDTTTYAVKPTVNAVGTTAFHPFGMTLNVDKTLRHSYIYNFRGGATGTLDIFDIAGAATGSWISAVPYDNSGSVTFNSSSGSSYNAVDNTALISPVSTVNVPTNMYYFDVDKTSLRSYAVCPQASGGAVDGDRLACEIFVDGTDKKAFHYWIASAQPTMMRTMFIN